MGGRDGRDETDIGEVEMGTELLKYKYIVNSSRERVYIETGLYSTSKHLIVKPEMTLKNVL